MIRIDGANWTADFRISRALAEGYHASGLDDVVFFCVGDPEDLVGRLGTLVADETIKFYPNVLGTSDDPITSHNLADKVAELHERFPDVYVIGIEAGYGTLSQLGSIEITDRAFSTLRFDEYINDVTVNVVLRVRQLASSGASAGRKGVSKHAEQQGLEVTGQEASESADRGRRADHQRARGLKEAALEVGSDEPSYGRQAFKPLRPDQIDALRVQQLADKVIDGNLRFLSRIKKQPI